MKYVELKSTLKTNIKNNYLLVGVDEFLLNKSVELIFNALNINIVDLNYQKFIGESIDFKLVVNALNTMPFVDEKKLVVVYLNIKTTILHLSDLIEYLKDCNKSSVLVIVLGENTLDIKNMISKFETVDCNRLDESVVDKFVVSELKKYDTGITYGGLKLLNEYCVYDLTKIDKELTKLVSFVSNKKLIDVDDVQLLVNKTLEFQVFELTENLANKKKDKVFEILESMKSKKDSFKTIFPLIYNHFRRLFYVATSKANKSELGSMLGVKDYAITIAFKQSKMFTKMQLKNILTEFEDLDYKIKTSSISTELAIDYLVLKIINS